MFNPKYHSKHTFPASLYKYNMEEILNLTGTCVFMRDSYVTWAWLPPNSTAKLEFSSLLKRLKVYNKQINYLYSDEIKNMSLEWVLLGEKTRSFLVTYF